MLRDGITYGRRKMARPTKYNKTLLKKAEAYLETYFTYHGHVIPTVEGL
ncbi:unnamed protein product, partial [marine sediment metagenome]